MVAQSYAVKNNSQHKPCNCAYRMQDTYKVSPVMQSSADGLDVVRESDATYLRSNASKYDLSTVTFSEPAAVAIRAALSCCIVEKDIENVGGKRHLI